MKVKSELNDSQMIRIKEEIFDDDDNRMQSTSQVGSDYSDWSDGEDDELLVLENSDQKMNKGTMIATSMNGERTVMIKEEMEDSITGKCIWSKCFSLKQSLIFKILQLLETLKTLKLSPKMSLTHFLMISSTNHRRTWTICSTKVIRSVSFLKMETLPLQTALTFAVTSNCWTFSKSTGKASSLKSQALTVPEGKALILTVQPRMWKPRMIVMLNSATETRPFFS